MGKSNEQKVAEALVELTENHWFNPATLGRILSNQPIYTLDRVMEMISQIIHYQNQRFQEEYNNGRTSHGLLLANELNKTLKQLSHTNQYTNIKLPK